ncbi:DapH/DapD/GlmU-related protein [Devosia sp.]|uniref:acyltransferase n=1 Tax=Devosia sp. TaxID=1871048 RepID=UPI002735BADF|nr:acyltransferase [Devosia sp.]MDP2782490.1 acyltransferase [Devosia sp.]
MSGLHTRILNKLWSLWFALVYGPSFRMIGRGSFLFRPFRIDGADGIEIGQKTILQRGSWLYCCGVGDAPASLKLGKGCVFGYNNHIASVRDVVIGDYVLTANNVYISDNLHCYEDTSKPIMRQPVRFKRAVAIGDGCWIGENACIIGARIGKNCVIGANAVVTCDIPDYSVAVGIPAVVIRQFDPHSQKWISVKRP